MILNGYSAFYSTVNCATLSYVNYERCLHVHLQLRHAVSRHRPRRELRLEARRAEAAGSRIYTHADRYAYMPYLICIYIYIYICMKAAAQPVGPRVWVLFECLKVWLRI